MEIQLRSVGTSNIGFVFPEKISTQVDLRVGNICAFASVENGIKLMLHDPDSEQLKIAYQQGEIGYVSTIVKLGGDNNIGVSVPQEILQQFDLEISDVVPLMKIGDCLQLMATRKPKNPRSLILKDKTPQEKRMDELQEKIWQREKRRPMGWWLDDYAD